MRGEIIWDKSASSGVSLACGSLKVLTILFGVLVL